MPRAFSVLLVLGILGSAVFAQNSGSSQSTDRSKPSPIVATLDQSRHDMQKKQKKARNGPNNQSPPYPAKAIGITDPGIAKPAAASPADSKNAELGAKANR
jgi:hypothetical protein